MKRKPRWWRHFRAWLGGYFWLPCDICGEYFSGHEPNGIVWLTKNHGRGICVLCAIERQPLVEAVLIDTTEQSVVWTGRAKHEIPYSVAERTGE